MCVSPKWGLCSGCWWCPVAGEARKKRHGRSCWKCQLFCFFFLCRFRECAVVCTPSQERCLKERQKQRQRQTDREREVADASSAWRSVRLGSAQMLRSVGRTFLSPRETVTEPLPQILLCRLAGHSFCPVTTATAAHPLVLPSFSLRFCGRGLLSLW